MLRYTKKLYCIRQHCTACEQRWRKRKTWEEKEGAKQIRKKSNQNTEHVINKLWSTASLRCIQIGTNYSTISIGFSLHLENWTTFALHLVVRSTNTYKALRVNQFTHLFSFTLFVSPSLFLFLFASQCTPLFLSSP